MTGTELHWQLPLGLGWPSGVARSSHSGTLGTPSLRSFPGRLFSGGARKAHSRMRSHFRSFSRLCLRAPTGWLSFFTQWETTNRPTA